VEVSQCLVVMVVQKGEISIATICDESAVVRKYFARAKNATWGVMQDPGLPVSEVCKSELK
jgi:hypothetical protein